MSQYYVGVKIIEVLCEEERDGKPGYSVRYEDGYVSWSPKDTLEKAYLKMGKDRNKVTDEMLDKLQSKMDSRTTILGFLRYVLRWGNQGLK